MLSFPVTKYDNTSIKKKLNSKTNLEIDLKTDVLLIFTTDNKEMAEEYNNLSCNLIFKLNENVERYSLIFSMNKKNYATMDELLELMKLYPNYLKTNSLMCFDVFSLNEVPKPNQWIKFLSDHYDDNEIKSKNNASDVLDYLDYICLELHNLFEKLKNPSFRFITKITNKLILGYKMEIPQTSKYFLNKSTIHCLLLNKNVSVLDISVNAIFGNAEGIRSLLIPVAEEAPFEHLEENLFFSFSNEPEVLFQLYPIMLKSVIQNFCRCEYYFVPGENLPLYPGNTDFDFEEKDILYKQIVEQEYSYIFPYIMNTINKYNK